uniref:Secreted protein n=1 Tax=Panagrellus redivivus TaxID=6233 RepID=A0A7E4W3N2_PANRE
MIGRVAVVALLAIGVAVYAHPQFRTLSCSTPDGQLRGGKDRAVCTTIFKDSEDEKPGRPAPANEGCFSETVNGEERVYCALICPEAHTVFNAHINQGHRSCFNFYTYQLEKRENDWYMWRSGKCLNSTVEFSIGCKFDQPFNEIVKNDNEIFARLRARAARKLA